MPGIHRRWRIGIVDVTEAADEDKPRPRYCARCKDMFGILSLLGPRIIPPNKITGKAMPKPADYDSWLQCHECGTVYGKYEVKQEPQLGTLVEADSNPFDRSKGVIETIGKTRKFDRTGKTQMKRKRKQQIDNIKDPDVKIELSKPGTELVSYEEIKLG